MDEILGLRDPLQKFAIEMERQLRENDHKDGWDGLSMQQLINRVRQETGELEQAIQKARRDDSWGKVIEEAADVANFAMMIADLADDKAIPIQEDLDVGDDD